MPSGWISIKRVDVGFGPSKNAPYPNAIHSPSGDHSVPLTCFCASSNTSFPFDPSASATVRPFVPVMNDETSQTRRPPFGEKEHPTAAEFVRCNANRASPLRHRCTPGSIFKSWLVPTSRWKTILSSAGDQSGAPKGSDAFSASPTTMDGRTPRRSYATRPSASARGNAFGPGPALTVARAPVRTSTVRICVVAASARKVPAPHASWKGAS